MNKLSIALFGLSAFVFGLALNATPPTPAPAEKVGSCVGMSKSAAIKAGLASGYPVVLSKEDDASDGVRGYTLASSGGVGGLWVQRDYTRAPYAAIYSDSRAGNAAVIGVARSQAGTGFDFAVVARKDEVYFQIRDEKGKFHFVPVAALLKLADKE